MALKDVTPDELSIAINRVGTAEVAKLGYFHALPYGSGGGGGDYGGKMFMAAASPNGPPGFYAAVFDIGEWIPPLTVAPFTRSVVLNPVVGYLYSTREFVSEDFRLVNVAVTVEWVGDGVDPGTGGAVNIGLKVEPFVLSG